MDATQSNLDFTYLQSLKHQFYHYLQNDSGIYDAMNKGIELAKGEWMYFLGSDDTLATTTTLETIASKLSNETSIIAGKVLYQGTTKPFIYSNKKQLKSSRFNFLMWIYNGVHHQAIFYNRSIFNALRFDTTFAILADYHFNLRLYRKGINSLLINEVVAICSSDGVSKKGYWKMYQEEVHLKVKESNIIFYPIFLIVAILKFSLKKTI